MAFWDDVKRNVSNFFGGNNQKKKKDEEEQRIKNAVSSPAPVSNPAQPKLLPQAKKPLDLFGTLNNTGLKVNKPAPVKKTKTQELEELTQQNMDKAMKETEQGQNWFDKGVNVFTGNNQKIARQNARNKAANQYQEKNGWNQDKEVMEFMGNTRKIGQKTSEDIRKQGEGLDKFEKNAYKAAKVMQYVPVAGSVLNVGLAASEGMGNKDAREVRNKIDFDMTNEQFDALDQETRDKLNTVRNIGLALSPLDFTGLGGLAKSAGVSAAKKGVIELVKDGAVDVATKQALKGAVKSSIKTAVPATILGGGVSAGAQQYLTGEVDPLEALKAGLMTGGTSMLIPNGNRVNVPTSRNIEINAPRTYNKRVPVGVQNTERPLINEMTTEPGLVPQPARTQVPIREVSGDTPGVNQVQVPTAADRFAEMPVARPDRTVEGMLPGRVEDTTLYTKAEVAAERAALDEQLATGGINKTAYKAASKELDSLPLSDAPTNKTQIKVREVRDIPVDDMGSMPDPVRSGQAGDIVNVRDLSKRAKNSLENDTTGQKPGGIERSGARVDNASAKPIEYRRLEDGSISIVDGRHTMEYARKNGIDDFPMKDVTDQYTPKAKQPTALPDEVQAVLDNPKQFNKRQVASARNQRKLANQMAKTKEQTAEAIGRIESVSPEASTVEGFVPTGEFAKGVNGNAYQKTSRASEMQAAVSETANLSTGDVIRSARETAAQNGGGFNRRDIRNIAALFETKRLERGTPEWQEARQILKEDGTNWGQTGALRNYTMRRNASSDELISRFESKMYRLADDPSKIDSKLFDEVDVAETAFVETRDMANKAFDTFNANPTSANAKAYHAAQDAADKADKTAKQVEYKVAQTALKGNKDIQQVRELEKMAQSADMYQMDAVDASMLSGTGTFVRNFANATVGAVEEGMFGKVGARVSKLITKQNVGGGMNKQNVSGFGDGVKNIVDASKARAGVAGKNPIEHAKNWATTGNQMGDAVIDSQVKGNVADHYTQSLKGEGYKGRELRDRASVLARQDPDNVAETYQQTARVAAGLGAGNTRNNKIETTVKNIISDVISGGKPNAATENAAKLVTRLTLGFPTAIGRSVVEGTKRFTLGAPTFVKAGMTKDPQVRALLIKEGIKQAGSGATVIAPLFYGLGSAGVITGGYPEDQAERDRWAREGITENSIKIGDDYFQLPAYLGSWAIPGLFYASLGRNGGDWGAAASDVAKAAPDLLPTGGIDSVLDVVNGRKDIGKYMSQLIPSAVRASTPAGALLNQLAKTFDSTQNETSDGTVMENIVAKIMNGIPGVANSLENKTDAEGNELANPDPFALAMGAASTEQAAGVAQTGVLNDQTNSIAQSMADTGAFSDPNLKATLTDDATKKIYTNLINGKQVSPDDLEKLQKAMVKGVSEKGTDTAYLEREQYDTNLTALQIKKSLMESDPTTKPSDLKQMDVAIKRGEVYRDNEVPYELIDAYQNTGVDEWRKMGDPESDEFNNEMYQQLWAIDEMMTKAGVSYKKGALDKQKFSAKGSGSGKGGSKNFSSDFGQLKTGTGAPSVQQYETLDQRAGGVPIIQVQRPNIVHKIGYSG